MVLIQHYGPRELQVVAARYVNGRLAVYLLDGDEPYATVSINIPEVPLGEGEFLFKTYSENEGLLPELERTGVVEVLRRDNHNGLGLVPVCRLRTGKAAAMLHDLPCTCGLACVGEAIYMPERSCNCEIARHHYHCPACKGVLPVG